jgi:hypothetical protein
MKTWKIWYSGGGVVSGNTLEQWIAAPLDGVLGVYEFLGWDNGLKMGNVHVYGDWYWMSPDGSIGQSESLATDGTFIEPNNPNGSFLKRGGMASQEEMSSAFSQMMAEASDGN